MKKWLVLLSTCLVMFACDEDNLMAPVDLQVDETTNTSITLSWQDMSQYESGYEVERAEFDEANPTVPEFKSIGKTAANAQTYTDSTVAGETTYLYRVRAFNAKTVSDYSNVAKASTEGGVGLPNVPTNLESFAPEKYLTTHYVYLVWEVDANEAHPIDSLTLERSEQADFTGNIVSVDLPGLKTEYWDTTLVPGKTVYYRIKATNAKGSSDYCEVLKLAVPALTETGLNAPGDLKQIEDPNALLTIAWTDNTTVEDGFQVWHSKTGEAGSFEPIADSKTIGPNVVQFSDESVMPESVNFYMVMACKGNQRSDFSNTIKAVAKKTTVLPPANPENFKASAITHNTLQLSWDHSTKPGGERRGYILERADKENPAEADFQIINQTSTMDPSYDGKRERRLSPDTTYTYRIYAWNDATDPKTVEKVYCVVKTEPQP